MSFALAHIVARLQHHWQLLAAAAAGLLLLLLVVRIVRRRRPQKLNPEYFRQRWQDLQQQCGSKATWRLAVIDADQLLDEALKKRRYKGRTMGERLVAAQRSLSDNEAVWFSHKLRNKLVHEDYKLRNKNEVKEALLGYLQALKDIGALQNDK